MCVKMNKNKSLRSKLLIHNLHISNEIKMKSHDFQMLDLILNNLNSFIAKCAPSRITGDIILLRTKLERVIGKFRNPIIYDIDPEEAAHNVYNQGYSVTKSHLTSSSEIHEIWQLIETSFEKPASPPKFSSSSSPSSLSGSEN